MNAALGLLDIPGTYDLKPGHQKEVVSALYSLAPVQKLFIVNVLELDDNISTIKAPGRCSAAKGACGIIGLHKHTNHHVNAYIERCSSYRSGTGHHAAESIADGAIPALVGLQMQTSF